MNKKIVSLVLAGGMALSSLGGLAEGAVFTEIFTDTKQVWEPKSSTKRLEDGTLVSPPLEDLAPFLPRAELESIMEIPLMPEN